MGRRPVLKRGAHHRRSSVDRALSDRQRDAALRRRDVAAFFGSDEVGIKILAVPLFPDLTSGEAQAPNGGDPIRFDDVDSGETRGMDHLLFSHQQPIAGAALSIMGFEVDGEDAFKNQINSFTDAFIEILKDEIALLKDHLEEVEAIVESSPKRAGGCDRWRHCDRGSGRDRCVRRAVGASRSDHRGRDRSNALDLVELTSVNFPLPLPSEHVTPQGIKVR